MRKDSELWPWKQQYKYLSMNTWSPTMKATEIHLENNRRTAVNEYNKTEDEHTTTWKSCLGVSGVSTKRFVKRKYDFKIDHNPYIVACGIAPNTANVDLDLSGSDPSISLFSNGYHYAYPHDIKMRVSAGFVSHSTKKFQTGDVISVIVDMSVGAVEFRKNNHYLVDYILPNRLTMIEWFPAVTLSRFAKITLLVDFGSPEAMELSNALLTPMDVDEIKTSSSLAQ